MLNFKVIILYLSLLFQNCWKKILILFLVTLELIVYSLTLHSTRFQGRLNSRWHSKIRFTACNCHMTMLICLSLIKRKSYVHVPLCFIGCLVTCCGFTFIALIFLYMKAHKFWLNENKSNKNISIIIIIIAYWY